MRGAGRSAELVFRVHVRELPQADELADPLSPVQLQLGRPVVNVALSKSAGAQLFANAQQYGYEVSGHVGIQFPLATFTSAPGASSPTTIGDHFNINFPFGLGVKPNWSPVLVDFEFVPEVHPNTRATTFLARSMHD